MQRQLTLWIFRAFVLLTPLIWLQPAFAEWYKDYEAAVELIGKQQYASAIPKLQAAIREKGEEGSNIKFYGMKFGDYFPHFYMGVAYFYQKNYAAALQEFEISERTGAIQRKNKLATQMQNLKTLARAQQNVSTPPAVIAKNEPPPVVVAPPIQKEPEPSKEEPPAKSIEATKIQEPQPKVEQQTKEPPVITTPPPAEPKIDVNAESAKEMVKRGARKYFEGDYDGAVYLLTSATEVNPKDSAAHFLLGCAYASKYLLSGAQDQNLKQNASNAFGRSKKLSPVFRIKDTTYFSPAVLKLYQTS